MNRRLRGPGRPVPWPFDILTPTVILKSFAMGWLAVLLTYAVWFSVGDCACEIGRIGTYIFFAGWLSINFIATALVIGIPCVLILARTLASHSSLVWSAVGVGAFAVPNSLYGALFQHDHGLDGAMFFGVFAGIGGGASVYFAQRQAGALPTIA